MSDESFDESSAAASIAFALGGIDGGEPAGAPGRYERW
jgi:hypothetical protein